MASALEVEVVVASAKNLKNVNWKNGSLRPYAVLWLDPASKCSTKVDVENDDDPVWDDKLTIPLPPHISIPDAILSVDVVHANAEEGVKPLVGSARLCLQQVVDEVGIGTHWNQTIKLKRPSGRPQGKIELKVCIRESPRYYDPRYMPPPTYASSHGYGYGYGEHLAPQGYAYGSYYGAPPPHNYEYGGYGAPLPEPEKKSRMGVGTGVAIGAAAGLVGGVALYAGIEHLENEIAEDVAEKVEEDLGYCEDEE